MKRNVTATLNSQHSTQFPRREATQFGCAQWDNFSQWKFLIKAMNNFDTLRRGLEEVNKERNQTGFLKITTTNREKNY